MTTTKEALEALDRLIIDGHGTSERCILDRVQDSNIVLNALINAPEVVTFDEFQVWVDTHSLMYDFLSAWEKRFPNGLKIVRGK